MTRILNTQEVCGWLGLTKQTVVKLANQGVLPGRLVGGEWRFREDLILDYLAGNPKQTEAEPANAAA